jgi:hypothetical protein
MKVINQNFGCKVCGQRTANSNEKKKAQGDFLVETQSVYKGLARRSKASKKRFSFIKVSQKHKKTTMVKQKAVKDAHFESYVLREKLSHSTKNPISVRQGDYTLDSIKTSSWPER